MHEESLQAFFVQRIKSLDEGLRDAGVAVEDLLDTL